MRPFQQLRQLGGIGAAMRLGSSRVLAHPIGVGIFAGADRIVDDGEIGPEAGDPDPDPDGVILSALVKGPPKGRRRVRLPAKCPTPGRDRQSSCEPSAPIWRPTASCARRPAHQAAAPTPSARAGTRRYRTSSIIFKLSALQTLCSASDISLMVSGSNPSPTRYGRMGMTALLLAVQAGAHLVSQPGAQTRPLPMMVSKHAP